MTQLEETLDYHASFDPAIAPFKRVTSLDAVVLDDDGVTPLLSVHQPRRSIVAIEDPDAPPPDPRPRDQFWGHVRLDFSQGRAVPLPSVSPDSRILWLKSEPKASLRIERDGADNFFVIGLQAQPSRVSIALLTDAPRAYFGTPLPAGPVDVLAAEVPPMPASIKQRALAFAGEIGLSPKSTLADALSVLTEHFRSFEESDEPPPDSGDIYLDLARSKKGICRHRAYAFAITAQALGIPTRFVQNEAHSWVETKLPTTGWMRIDLGGAANGMRAHAETDRTLYHPANPDPLPRPEAYEQSYSQASAETQGLRSPNVDALAGRWLPTEEIVPAQSAQPLRPLALSVAPDATDVLRGHELAVRGRVHDDDGRGVEGMRIEVSLASAARTERLLLGVVTSGPDGRYQQSFEVPPDLAVGDYELVAVTPGDAMHSPAKSE
jgi:hypothetical protein